VHWLSHALRDLRSAFWAVPAHVDRAAVLLAVLGVVGTSGYIIIEGWPFLDALYMTVIVLTTIGFAEVRELSDTGRVFTIFIAIFGIGAIFYALIAVFQFLLEGELESIIGSQRMERQIEHLSNHYILCGFGRVGEEIAREFKDRSVDFVVIETTPEAIERAGARGYLTVVGDASSDAVLRQARIEHATCLLAASDSDSGNTFIVLAAKALNPDLYVVARAAQPDSAPRMTRAGAERVFSPYIIAGRQMALSAIQPLLTEFIDTHAGEEGREGVLGEIEVSDGAGAGSTVDELLAGCRNVTVLAIQRKGGELYVGASGSIRLSDGDRVIVLGNEDELQRIGPSGSEAPASSA
jgi:voltage-gated potassium channel